MKRRLSSDSQPSSASRVKRRKTPCANACAPRTLSLLSASSQTSALGALPPLQASLPDKSRVESWLASSLPLTPPPDAGLTRKRAMSPSAPSPTSSHRSGSPKRRRPNHADDIGPEQSASQIGSTALALNARNTFSPTPSQVSSGPKRSSSPTRETTIILRSAWPPVITESLNGLEDAPPAHVDELGDRLAKGVDTAFIPQGLQDIIKSDPEVGHQTTKLTDFDYSDMRSVEELSTIWEEVKIIFLNARDCKSGTRDENAWCDDVVRPLIYLAMKLYGDGKWWLQSVQSQSINPLYLPTISAPTASDATRRKTIDRKIDYVLSYSHRDPSFADLYKRLAAVNRGEIGHTLDAFTKRTALFSGFEVKPASGDHTEAELQMSVAIAAAIRKKQALTHDAQIALEPTLMVEPTLTIVGHEHSIYYAYPRKDGIHVLGPDLDRFERLSTDSIRGVFRLLRVYRNILEYGADGGENGYLGRFFRPVLEKLASNE